MTKRDNLTIYYWGCMRSTCRLARLTGMPRDELRSRLRYFLSARDRHTRRLSRLESNA